MKLWKKKTTDRLKIKYSNASTKIAQCTVYSNLFNLISSFQKITLKIALMSYSKFLFFVSH